MRFSAVLLICCGSIAAVTANDQQPNILFILTDDQGWGSLSCYGNEYVKTPHLDSLAADGLRFTDAYVMPQCTPTRAALLTGQHTARNGMWHVIGWYGSPWAPVSEPMYREHLAPEQCHLPHQLQAAGYTTGMAGKWHLTNNEHGHYVYLKETSAQKFGFDEVAPPGKGSQNEGDKWVDHLTDCACRFMERNQDRPWFYYLSHHTLHGKVSAPKPLIQKYLDQGAPAEGLQNATYLAAIEHLDRSVGRLLKQLDDLQLRDKTLVVFLADNGGVDTQYNLPEWDDAPLNGSQPLSVKEQQFDNAPLREGKGSVYEGGIRVPCLVSWPAKIRAPRIESTPIHVVDWLPTLLSAAGVEPLSSADGVNLVPLFEGTPLPERSLFWYLPLYDLRWASTPSAAIRTGDWKLIYYFGDRYDANQKYHLGASTELYHLGRDLSESNDLSESDPERTQQMRERLFRWMKSIPVAIPNENPHHDPERALLETKQKQPWMKPYQN